MDLRSSPRTTPPPPALLRAPRCPGTGRLGTGPTVRDVSGKPSGKEEERGDLKSSLKQRLFRKPGTYLPGNSHDNRLTFSLMKFKESSKGK